MEQPIPSFVKPPAFQFYADDFVAGTADMTAEEVGVYMRLLCYQWSKGGLPADDARLAIIAGQCQTDAVATAKAKFTLGEDGLLRNARLEVERTKQNAYRLKQAQNATKRWLATAKPDATAMPPHMPEGIPNTCSPSPSPSPIKTPLPPEGEVLAGEEGKDPKGFVEFWEAYAKKVAKPKAARAWKRIPLKLHATIIADVTRRFRDDPSWTKEKFRYAPNPASYLNERRWTDGGAAMPSSLKSSPARFPGQKFWYSDEDQREINEKMAMGVTPAWDEYKKLPDPNATPA